MTPEFAEAIAALFETFGAEASDAKFLGYWIGLEDIQIRDLQTAVQRAIRESKFLPKPAELRSLAGSMSDATRAVLAWEIVTKSIIQIGSYRSVDFEDPAINAAIRTVGGWEWICDQPDDQLQRFIRQKFIDAYVQLARRPLGDRGKYLIGLTEADNRRDGFDQESFGDRRFIPCDTTTESDRQLARQSATEDVQLIEGLAEGIKRITAPLSD